MAGSTRWLVMLSWVLVLAWSAEAQAQTRAASVLELKDGWLYRWGDSPLAPDGVPTWAKEPDKVDWKSMEALKVPPGREAHTMLWVSIPIPQGGWGEPALMLGSVANAYEAYVDGQRIYANGKVIASGAEVPESIWAQLIPLPVSAQGSRVLLRIQSSTATIGVGQQAKVGPRHELLARVVRTGLGCLITGNLLLVIAQVCLGMSLLGRERRMMLALGVFAGGAGVLLVGVSGVVSAVWGVELPLWRATFLASYCVLPGLGWFIHEGILQGRSRWFGWVVWPVTVLAALQAVVAMVDMGLASRLFQFLTLYAIPCLLVYVGVVLLAAFRGNVEARIFGLGLGVLTLVLLLSMMPLWGWVKLEGMYIHWGFLAFTVSLVGIVARRSTHVVRSLSSHANQLEARRKDVRELAEGMGTGAGELATVAQQLRTSSEAQTDGIGRQATALKELEQTVQEIRQGSLVTADKARVLAESVVAAEEAGRDGGAALDKTLMNLEAIREEVSEMARRILALDARTREIVGIVDTVKGLADQSNMLAVNAAIEAARSGEHGRGFSVVSREVRSLADQSILATQRIREVLEGVSGSMREAAKMSEQGEQRVRVSVEAVRVSGTQLRKLASIIGDTSNSVRQISAAVSQQDAGTSQIAVAIQDMSGQMQQTLRVVEETRNVTRSVQTLAESMAGSARKAIQSGTLGS